MSSLEVPSLGPGIGPRLQAAQQQMSASRHSRWNRSHSHSQMPETTSLNASVDVIPPFHLHPKEDVLEYLAVPDSKRGLTSDEVELRRAEFGANALAEVKRRSNLAILLSHLLTPVTLILGVVFGIAIANTEWVEAVVVVLVIALNSGVGAVQEAQAEAALEAIRHLAGAQSATVVRDGEPTTIPIADVVIGDVVELRQGQSVPADIRLTDVHHFEVDEALLTGESAPVNKTSDPVELSASPKQQKASTEKSTAARSPRSSRRATSTGQSSESHAGSSTRAPAAGSSSPSSPSSSSGGKAAAVALGDRLCMAYRQTTVVHGYARGVVVAVGMGTEIGRIAASLGSRKGGAPKTPMTAGMSRLFYLLVLIGLIFGVFIIWAFKWDVNSVSLLYASATLVAILPEAAVVLITVTLAIGARRIAARNAIVRKMSALEQLGRVTDVCSDKTGTLTQGRMRPARLLVLTQESSPDLAGIAVEGPHLSRAAEWTRVRVTDGAMEESVGLKEWASGGAPVRGNNSNSGTSFASSTGSTARGAALESALLVCALCSSVRLRKAGASSPSSSPGGDGDNSAASSSSDSSDPDKLKAPSGGNATEIALQELVHKACAAVPELESHMWGVWEERGEWGFDSTLKRMTTGWYSSSANASVCLTKGAPERVMPLCANVDQDTKQRLEQAANAMARGGLRVLALARRDDLDLATVDSLPDIAREEVECNLRLVGLVAVRDPPKPESSAAVEQCKIAGISVRMLTGDHKETAAAIAREIGILEEGPSAGLVLTGPELDEMTDEQVDALPDLPVVVARSSPETKVRIVDALHRRNRIAAMTGDGVNDSPALRAADVSIAMGVAGSDVTKGVADIILADDNFATIVAAIEEGRRILDSVSNFVMHLLSGNVAEAVALMISLAFVTDADDLPVFVLSPLAVLYVNTATGSGPAVGLALDKPAPDIMERPPPGMSFFTWEMIADFSFYGAVMGGLTLGAFSVMGFALSDDGFGMGCNKSGGTDCDNVLRARGTAFLVINTLLLLHAFECRHQRASAFMRGMFENRVLVLSLLVGTLLAVPLMYIPYLNDEVFKHDDAELGWALALGSCVIYMMAAELYKAFKRRVWGRGRLREGASPPSSDGTAARADLEAADGRGSEQGVADGKSSEQGSADGKSDVAEASAKDAGEQGRADDSERLPPITVSIV